VDPQYPTPPLVELWIRLSETWHLLETFDSRAPEFAKRRDPVRAAACAAWWTGAELRKISAIVSSFELRPKSELRRRRHLASGAKE
jgi:hypothetical protein